MESKNIVNYSAFACVIAWIFLGVLAALHVGTPGAAVVFLTPVSVVVGVFFVIFN